MDREDPRRLLDDVGVLKHPCDLDLLLFFSRHPRALVTSEQLAAWLGYELAQIADSLDVLLGAGVLTRSQNRTHAARLYVLSTGVVGGGSFPSLLAMASTRMGRLGIRVELSRRRSTATRPPVARHGVQAAASRRGRPFVIRRQSDGRKTG
jgi:hypothetical protein